MITYRTEVTVQGITCTEFLTFMLNCTDADYQEWWPGTHLAFHTVRRFPEDIGNIVYFDEYVGKHRLKFRGVVLEHIPGRKISWQMIFGIRLPAWLDIECEERTEGLHILHTVSVGLEGIGCIFDPLIQIYFTDHFFEELDQHAHIEFPMLAELLISRKTALKI